MILNSTFAFALQEKHQKGYLSKGLGDTGLDVVGCGTECFAALGHEASSKVAQSPVVVNIWPQTQLLTDNACHHSWDELMQL